MKETIKHIRDRWNEGEWSELRTNILKNLKSRKSINSLTGLPLHDDRIDLRGISFPKEFSEYRYKGENVKQVVGSIRIKKVHFQDLDLSYSDLQQVKLVDCTFNNVIFKTANLEQIEFKNCGFENVQFLSTRLSYSFLNIRKKNKSGYFKNVRFIKTLLNETRCSFPEFIDCVFDDCNLHAADFDGGRFKNCTFKGIVNSPWFRKYSIGEFEPNYIFNRIDKTQFRNEMINVDFSSAKLEYVDFDKKLDLSTCKFPDSIRFEKIEQLKDSLIAHS